MNKRLYRTPKLKTLPKTNLIIKVFIEIFTIFIIATQSNWLSLLQNCSIRASEKTYHRRQNIYKNIKFYKKFHYRHRELDIYVKLARKAARFHDPRRTKSRSGTAGTNQTNIIKALQLVTVYISHGNKAMLQLITQKKPSKTFYRLLFRFRIQFTKKNTLVVTWRINV